jgi:hypothetical protein
MLAPPREARIRNVRRALSEGVANSGTGNSPGGSPIRTQVPRFRVRPTPCWKAHFLLEGLLAAFSGQPVGRVAANHLPNSVLES